MSHKQLHDLFCRSKHVKNCKHSQFLGSFEARYLIHALVAWLKLKLLGCSFVHKQKLLNLNFKNVNPMAHFIAIIKPYIFVFGDSLISDAISFRNGRRYTAPECWIDNGIALRDKHVNHKITFINNVRLVWSTLICKLSEPDNTASQ